MISLRQYYFFAIWLPIIVPVVLLYRVYPLGEETEIDYFSMMFVSAVPFYGVQYLVFLAWIIYKHRKATTNTLREFSLIAPFYFLPFELASIIFAMLLSYIGNDLYDFMFIITICIIVFGYFYVGIAHALGFILTKIGFIKPDSPQTAGNE